MAAAFACLGAGREKLGDIGQVDSDGSLEMTGRASQAVPAGLREAVAQTLPSFAGPGGSSCVIDTAAVLGWWAGENDLSAVIGSTLSGSVSFGAGEVSSGFEFDGAQSVSLGGLTAVSDAVSVETWVKPVQTGGTQVLVSRWDFPSEDDGARAFELSLNPSGSLVWSTDETSTRRPEEFAVAAPSIFDGAWHHVAATWGGGQMAVFFDGVQVGSKASQGGVLNPASSTPMRLGAKSGNGTPLFFSGGIDEPTVWGRALSATEVAAIHAAGSAGKCTTGGVVSQQAKLTASDGAIGDIFGLSVSLDGDTAIVGALNTDDNGPNSGSAYVFVRTGTAWTQQAELVASDAAAGDNFGLSVALDGDTAIVSAMRDDDAGSESGSAYVFVRSGSTWAQQAKLTAADAAAGERFGISVDIDGTTAIVGADFDSGAGTPNGAAYVFERSGTTWSQQTKLVAADGAPADYFGGSVAIAGGTALVGAWLDDDNGSASGSAYVFVRAGSVWSQQAKLIASDGDANDYFGAFVDVDGATALVGAHNDDDGGSSSGSAYVFVRAGSVWSQQAKLTASDAAAGDVFGYSGSIEGDVAIVGAPWTNDAATSSGSVYLFARAGSVWTQQAELVASDAAYGDFFGYSVSSNNGTLLVGSYGDSDNGTESGSAYVFTGL